MTDRPKCTVCGETMPEGEEMFMFHGYSGPCPKAPLPKLPNVVADIVAERKRQVEVKGWTAAHDDKHKNAALALAAACYALETAAAARGYSQYLNEQFSVHANRFWPFDDKWWKPSEPRSMLVKAAALIVAEIERLDRAAAIRKG